VYDIDLEKMNRGLVKAVRLVAMVRKYFGKEAADDAGCLDLEREIREAAAECQRVLGLVKEDDSRPLVGTDGEK